MAKGILLFVVLLSVSCFTFGATKTTTSTPGVWSPAGAPGSTDDIIVNHDWRNYDAAQIANYSGTMTINNGGYYKMAGSFTTTAGAVIIIATTGNFRVTGASSTITGATITNNGHFEVNGSLTLPITVGGTGTYNVGGGIDFQGTGSFGSNTLGTLPVELISFSGEIVINQTILRWSTGSEINNSHFEIQKSIDGKSFETIGIVEGNGNSTELIEYNYVDLDVSTAYYRLKQIDYDLNFEYSDVILIENESSSISIIQNLTSNQFLITGNGNYTINLFSVNGKLIFKKELFINGQELLIIPSSYSGYYVMNVESNFEITTKKGIINL